MIKITAACWAMVVYVGLQLLLAARNYILHTSVPSLVEVKFHILQKSFLG